MHRFVWDLRYPTPDALHHEYPISAIYRDTPRGPQGALALPGSYTVKLTVDRRSFTQPLTIRMDPRVTATPAALARQFTLARRITSLMHDDWTALQEVRAARAANGPLADSLRALESKRGPAGAEGLAPLNEQLATLLEIVDGADAAPTTQTEAALAGVERTLRARLSDWARLKAAISR
jgi:hypothetical protein